MQYDARQIANEFIRRAAEDGGRVLSIMTLLKLVYIAHGWMLALYNRPLFPNRIEAWQYGPVVLDVYQAYRNQGVDIRNPIKFEALPLDPQAEDLLGQISSNYGHLSPFQLSDLTHIPNGPWDIAMRTGGKRAPILDELIKHHYLEKRQNAEAAS